jgi:hypothetical protein
MRERERERETLLPPRPSTRSRLVGEDPADM